MTTTMTMRTTNNLKAQGLKSQRFLPASICARMSVMVRA
jgi:hypothetical protein